MTRHFWSVTHASRLLVACLLMLPFSNQSSGKGGGMQSEDRYNPDHIESLPLEIRAAVIRQCGTPKALHTFVSYSEN